MPHPTHARQAIAPTIVLLLAWIPVAGCNSKAHNDLYQQRLTSEIRVLEDQLYDADYQNRVLRDKIKRLQIEAADSSESQRGPSSGARSPNVRTDQQQPAAPTPDSMPDMPSDIEFDMGDSLDSPFLDDEIPGAESDPSAEGDATRSTLTPPSEPEPPGPEDLELPSIFEGESVEPPSADQDADTPLGQIKLPDSLIAKEFLAPATVRIHPGLSGGHLFDGDDRVGGLFLVINAVDKLGKTVNLEEFDIAAEMTVVVLDPSREGEAARLGRWEYKADEVKALIRDEPTSGIHVPVRWKDVEPESDEVVVHVRLRADEDEMRCEATIKVTASAAMAKWTPRGERLE